MVIGLSAVVVVLYWGFCAMQPFMASAMLNNPVLARPRLAGFEYQPTILYNIIW